MWFQAQVRRSLQKSGYIYNNTWPKQKEDTLLNLYPIGV